VRRGFGSANCFELALLLFVFNLIYVWPGDTHSSDFSNDSWERHVPKVKLPLNFMTAVVDLWKYRPKGLASKRGASVATNELRPMRFAGKSLRFHSSRQKGHQKFS